MKQIIDFLINSKKVNKKNIIYINLEIDYIKYKDINDLDQYIKNYIKAEKII
jgi:hypothetical protein